jgi:SAM-dependent methyltransferase
MPTWWRSAAGAHDDPRRLTRRTSAVHRAKITGRHAAHVAAELAADHLLAGHRPTVLDIGCGRGASTRALAARLRPALLIALDASTALVREARSLAPSVARVAYVTGDFHRLPLLDCCCHLVLAAFCLYHHSADRCRSGSGGAGRGDRSPAPAARVSSHPSGWVLAVLLCYCR